MGKQKKSNIKTLMEKTTPSPFPGSASLQTALLPLVITRGHTLSLQ